MNHLSPEEVATLLSSVSAVAARHGCSFNEAVRHLTQLAEASDTVIDRPRRDTHEFARRLLRVRAQRNDLIGTESLRDPSWDMLLDLYGNESGNGAMMISALCMGSGVPQTTALRHIYRMVELGLLEVADHATDQRRTMVRLADHVAPRIARLLAMIQDCV
jgi:DNA-binding MarR family transcriptional regulator